MRTEAAKVEAEAECRLAYSDSREHLADGLKRLDFRVHLQVLSPGGWCAPDPLEQLKGIGLSYAEILSLVWKKNPLQRVRPGDEGCRFWHNREPILEFLGVRLARSE